jgi:hypothetical protein
MVKQIEKEDSKTTFALEDINEKTTNPPNVYEYDDDSAAEAWQKAYAAFLKSFPVLADYEVYEFSLKDLDNSGVPELIIVQSNATGGILTAYSYDDKVYKIGDYSDAKIGIAGLRVSNNLMYPGLFTCWWGGGVDHYGYLTVKEGRLTYEDLWYDDHLAAPPRQKELSGDKQLVKESRDAHPPYDYQDNLLKMYIINVDSIDDSIDDSIIDILRYQGW